MGAELSAVCSGKVETSCPSQSRPRRAQWKEPCQDDHGAHQGSNGQGVGDRCRERQLETLQPRIIDKNDDDIGKFKGEENPSAIGKCPDAPRRRPGEDSCQTSDFGKAAGPAEDVRRAGEAVTDDAVKDSSS